MEIGLYCRIVPQRVDPIRGLLVPAVYDVVGRHNVADRLGHLALLAVHHEPVHEDTTVTKITNHVSFPYPSSLGQAY